MRLKLVAAALLVASVACGSPRLARRSDPASTPAFTPVSVGGAIVISTPSPIPATSHASGAPLFVLQLTDQNGRHPAGIPVRLEGPENRTARSDAAGEIKIFKAGIYKATEAVGCHDDVFIAKGGGLTFQAGGAASSHEVLRLEWKHRVAPAPPVFADFDRDWPVGRKVTVTYSASDRCSEERVPNSTYPTYTFVPSSNVKVVGTPVLAADGRGQGHVTLQCTKPGKIDLGAVDRTNASDRINLFAYATGYSGTPRCAG